MKRIKKILIAAMIATMTFSVVGCSMVSKTPEAIAKTVIATIGDEEITLGQIDNEIKSDIEALKAQYGEDFESKLDPQLKEQLMSVRTQVVNQLVEETILLKKLVDLKLEPTPEELKELVQERVDSMIEMYGGQEQFDAAKEQFGYTDETFKEFIEKQVKAQIVRDEYTKEVKVTDEEVQKYYDENKETYVNQASSDVRHLLFKTEEEATKVSDSIKKGEKTFDEYFTEFEANNEVAMAEDASEEDKKLPIAENIGLVLHEGGNYDPAFVEGVKALGEGEISAPVKSSFGVHIIEAKNIKEAGQKPLDDELKEDIKIQLENMKKGEEYSKKYEELQKEFDVKLNLDKLK